MNEPARAVAPVEMPDTAAPRRGWQRGLWIAAGAASLLLGVIGIALPLLPTVPFILLAGFCFSRGSPRCERWLLEHPRLGPPLRAWRAHRAVPMRAKGWAIGSMAFGSALAGWLLPAPWHWAPAACCAAVAVWLWRLPTAAQEQRAR